MKRNADIVNELKELNSFLAEMSWQMPFALPDGYLISLARELTDSVRFSEIDDPSLTLPKALPFTAPEGYFEQLTQSLQAAAGEGGIEAGIASPYNAPEGYLDNLPEVLTLAAKKAEVSPASRGRIITFHPQWRKISRIAAAAVLVLGLGFGTYSYFHSRQPEVVAKRQLSKLDPMIIDTYVSQHLDEFDTETLEATVASAQTNAHETISTLDASDIQEYLQETGEINNTTDKETL